MASRVAAENEVFNLRLEISRLAKNQSEAIRELAILHVQDGQTGTQRRGFGAHGNFL